MSKYNADSDFSGVCVGGGVTAVYVLVRMVVYRYVLLCVRV